MGPELWILVGALGVATVLGSGFYLGWAFGEGARQVLEHQLGEAITQVLTLETQAKTSREAAGAVLKVEQGLADASAAGPVALAKYARLLSDDEKLAIPTPGEAEPTRETGAGVSVLDEGA